MAEALGPEAALSKSTAPRVCAGLRDDFEAFRSRDLSDIELDYLFLDGSHFRMNDGSRAEPVLVTYGITTLGRPVLLAVEPGGDESCDAWADFLEDLTDRGLRPPLLVVTDGAAGLIGAVETKMASSLRQRCLIHRCRNVLAKVPAGRRDELKAAFWAIFDLPEDIEPGQGAVSAAQAGIDGFARRHQSEFPAAVKCLLADRAALTAHLRFPTEHRAQDPPHQPHRAHLRRDPPTSQSHRPAPRRSQLPHTGMGRARPRLTRLARPHLHPRHRPNAHRAPTPTPPTRPHQHRPARPHRHTRRLT